MYISSTRFVNLGLPKAFIQLFRMQVNIPYMQARRDTLFQIGFCNFSGVLLHNQATCSKVTVCNLKDRNPDVQSQQSMRFNVITENNRKFTIQVPFQYNNYGVSQDEV